MGIKFALFMPSGTININKVTFHYRCIASIRVLDQRLKWCGFFRLLRVNGAREGPFDWGGSELFNYLFAASTFVVSVSPECILLNT